MPRQAAAKVSDVEYAKIERLVQAGMYINVSDFVRDAIRSRLAELTMGPAEVDSGRLEEEVLEYLRSRGGEAWPDDIASELGVSVLDVLEALESLRRKGKAVEARPVEREA